MIPSDIKITPLSGSGDSSVSMTMEEYTGRVAKPTREVWVYDAEDTASDMVEVDQYPKTEFIGLNDPLTFSVVALGGDITVTGTSNSPALKPVEFDEALKFELSINGEVQSSWSPDNPVITGDIGVDEEYSFSLKVTVPENQTTSQKPWTFQLSNNAQIVTATITINQAAGVKTYSDITISEFSYPIASAAGGTLTPTLSYSQTWGWNGRETGGGTVTSGATLSYEAIGGWHQSVLDPSTGIITAPSRGTVIAIQQTEFAAKVNVYLNGKTASLETDVTQEKNVPVSVAVSPSFAYQTSNIPASGGTRSYTASGTITITWSSGGSAPADESNRSGYTVSRHNTVSMTPAAGFSINTITGAITAENRGTTPGHVRSCGNVTRTLGIDIIIDEKYGGGTVTGSGTYELTSPVSQQENYVVGVDYTDWPQGASPAFFEDPSEKPKIIPASGGYVSNTNVPSLSGNAEYTFTSGATLRSGDAPFLEPGAPDDILEYTLDADAGLTIDDSYYNVRIVGVNRGTTEGPQLNCRTMSLRYTGYVKVSEEAGGQTLSWTGETSSDISYVYQEANVKAQSGIRIEKASPDDTWVAPENWDSVPAKDSFLYVKGYHLWSYTSGAGTETVINDSEYTSTSVHCNVSWAGNYSNSNGRIHVKSRITVPGDARTGNAYWVINGFTSNTLSFTQVANIQTQTGIRIEGDTVGGLGWIPYEYWGNINAAGMASDTPGASNTNGWAIKFTGYRQYSYTSGATDEKKVGSISQAQGAQKNVDWIGYHTTGYALNKQANSDNAYRGTTIGNERTAEVWWEENGFESNHLSITQAKNVPVSGKTTQADFSYPDNVIPPTGGSVYVEPGGALSLTWSSGATSSPSQPTGDVGYYPSTTYTMAEAEGFSILRTNGRITAKGMGSTPGSRSCGNVTRTLHYTVIISDTYGGGSFDTTSFTKVLTSPVTQGVNERIYDTPVITLGTPSDIPASGGTVSSVSVLSVVQPLHYTSGATATALNPARTNEVWTPVTVGTKGTTTSGRTVAGQLKYSCVCNGVAGSASVNVYQAANSVVSTKWTSASCTVEPSQRVLAYGGGTKTFTKSAVKNGTETYTSGATKEVTYSAAVWSSSIDYDSGSGWISSVDTQNDRITVLENPYASRRSATVTIKAALNGMSASDTILIGQNAAPAELDFEESTLGTVPSEGGYVYLTLHTNCNWGLTTNDASASAAIRTSGSTGAFSPISLTGDTASNSPGDWEVRVSFSRTTSSSRPLTVVAYSLTPALSATLNGTQESGAYLTVSPTSLTFDFDGGTRTLQISSNTSWTIDVTQQSQKIRIVNQDSCISCGTCESEGILIDCPQSNSDILGFNDEGKLTVLNPDSCIQCGTCAEILSRVCPAGIRIEFGN